MYKISFSSLLIALLITVNSAFTYVDPSPFFQNPFSDTREERFFSVPRTTVFLFYDENRETGLNGSVFFSDGKVEKLSSYEIKSFALLCYFFAILDEVKVENRIYSNDAEKNERMKKIKKMILSFSKKIIDINTVVYRCQLDNQNNLIFDKVTLYSECKYPEIRTFLEELGANPNPIFLDDSYLLEHSKELFEVDLRA